MEEQPLEGWIVLNTRSRDQARRLSVLLEARGATVAEVPTLELGAVASVKEIRDAIGALSESDWIVLTSESVVRFLEGAAARREPGERSWSDFRIAAVGEATAEAAERAGGAVKLVSTIARGEVLGEELADSIDHDAASSEGAGLNGGGAPIKRCRVLVLRAARGARGLVDALSRRGVTFDELGVYDTVVPTLSRSESERLSSFLQSDKRRIIALTSGECARNLRRLMESLEGEDAGERARRTIPSVAIGPEPADTARSVGFLVAATGAAPRLSTLVEEIERVARGAS